MLCYLWHLLAEISQTRLILVQVIKYHLYKQSPLLSSPESNDKIDNMKRTDIIIRRFYMLLFFKKWGFFYFA